MFASLENDHLSSCSILRSLMSSPTLRVSPYLSAAHFTSSEGTFWLSDLVFSGLSDALGLSDIENLLTVLISLLPASCLRTFFFFFFKKVSPYLSWILNFCSLTLLRRNCLIDWVTRVSACLSILTLTFDWCWIWCWTFNILRWWCRCRSRQTWQWRRRR